MISFDKSLARCFAGLNRRAGFSLGDVIALEDSDALWTALRGLAPGQRRVVVLRHYWGLSVDETAADLGISPGTVKSQTSDALARLRHAMSVAATPGEQA